MPQTITTVNQADEGMYERLERLASRADVTITDLAREIEVTPNALYQLKFRARRGTQASWSIPIVNALSTSLAARLDKRPAEIQAYLTGLEALKGL